MTSTTSSGFTAAITIRHGWTWSERSPKASGQYDARALHTAHGAPETAALDYWRGEPWLQVNNVYTYGPVYHPALRQYARPERMPFFLIESAYETEHETTERRLRSQAYQAVLSGAAGQIFGNNPIWHFDGPGLYAASVTWQQALGSRGAQSMSHLRNLLERLPLVAAGARPERHAPDRRHGGGQ